VTGFTDSDHREYTAGGSTPGDSPGGKSFVDVSWSRAGKGERWGKARAKRRQYGSWHGKHRCGARPIGRGGLARPVRNPRVGLLAPQRRGWGLEE